MKKNDYVVIGMGATGASCVRFLKKLNHSLVVMDTRGSPPQLPQFQQEHPDIPCYLGSDWPQTLLNQAKQIIISPGVSCHLEAIQQAKNEGVEVIGDVELFARFNQTPVIAITGSNGKSTVTTLVGEMAKTVGKNVAVLGNIGTPVLDILNQDNSVPYDLIVMELSSFQLETTESLSPLAATILNISPDHLDRYGSFNEYAEVKQRVYHRAKHVIINKQDPLSYVKHKNNLNFEPLFFTLEEPKLNEFGVRKIQGKEWLAWDHQNLIPTSSLKIMGQHNVANALSALALGYASGLPIEAMIQTLQTFTGLAHRCQHVAESQGVIWVNDSKGTNVGACLAALRGLGSRFSGKIVLLLGGDAKGADFTILLSDIQRYCREIIVMGKDANKILSILGETLPARKASHMLEAVKLAAISAQAGDIVLLSPACSSLDQYQNFSHRGNVFIEAVKEIISHA